MELARNLKIDSVSRLEPAKPLVLERTAPVTTVVTAMREHGAGCVLICEGHQLVGVFTERDLLRRVIAVGLDWNIPIDAVMTPNPVTVELKDPIRVAVRHMEKGGYRNLPVVDDAGRPVGVLSVMRIVHYLVEHFPVAVYNLPPDPHNWPTTPDGG
jgi:CBS domain-containing protein